MNAITKRKINSGAAFAVLLAALVLFAGAFLALPANAADAPETPYTSHVCVYNLDSGTLMYEEGADDAVYTGGTVKIMTALLAFEHYKDYNTVITVTAEMIEGAAGSIAGFEAGEEVPVTDLLAALIISNSNDAAQILACDIAGNTGAFLEMMNSRAAELGMSGTKYLNVTGLHNERMKTTARDVMTVSAAAVKYQKYTELSSQGKYTIAATNRCSERTLRNRNYFVSTYYNLNYYMSCVTGLSCSYTNEAGTCLALTARDDAGLTYIVVAMGSSDPDPAEENRIYACDDAAALIKWAFKSYDSFTVVGTGDMICEIPVRLSANVDHVIALPAEKITAFLPSGTDLAAAVTTEYTLVSDTLTAPVTKGEVIGHLTVFVNGSEFGEVDLIAKSNVDRSEWLFLRDKIIGVLTSPLSIVIIVLVVLAVIAYIVLMSIRVSRRQRRVRYK